MSGFRSLPPAPGVPAALMISRACHRLAAWLGRPQRPGRAFQIVSLTAVLLAGAFGHHPGPAAGDQARLRREAAVAAAGLQARFGAMSYQGTQYWQSANALQAVADYMRVTGSRAYLADLAAAFQAHRDSDRFLDGYYDDEGWWALTWITAYQLTGQIRYLDAARDIFTDMTGGWDQTCGGGIWWNKSRTYKNAIANELFLAVAARLHLLSRGDTAYAGWANREWAWFRGSGLLTASHLVVDGLANCRPILTSTTWTYNQGVLLGSLAGLALLHPGGAALRTARDIAGAVLGSAGLSPHGILREPCEAAGPCQTDARVFKGIFARNLKLLYDRVHDPRYLAYLRANARSMWLHDRRGGEFGLSWAGPFDRGDTATRTAALDILNTQAALTPRQP